MISNHISICIIYAHRFSLRTLKQFGFGKYTMQQTVQQDAVSFANMITELTKDGTPSNISSVVGAAIVNNLWFILEGTKYANRIKLIILVLKHYAILINVFAIQIQCWNDR